MIVFLLFITIVLVLAVLWRISVLNDRVEELENKIFDRLYGTNESEAPEEIQSIFGLTDPVPPQSMQPEEFLDVPSVDMVTPPPFHAESESSEIEDVETSEMMDSEPSALVAEEAVRSSTNYEKTIGENLFSKIVPHRNIAPFYFLF